MQDDDIAFGADQVLFAVQAMLSDTNVATYIPSSEVLSISSDVQDARRALSNYRAAFGLDERRTPPVHPMTNVQIVQVKKATAGAAALAGAGVTAGRVGIAGAELSSVSVRLIATGAVEALAWFTFFNALDDTPRMSDATLNRLRDALQSSLLTLVQDMADLYGIMSMAMTTAEAVKATTQKLIEALAEALRLGSAVAVDIIIGELIKRFPKCGAALFAVKSKLNDLFNIRKLKPGKVRIPGVGVVDKPGAVKGVQALLDLLQRETDALAQLSQLIDAAKTCMGIP